MRVLPLLVPLLLLPSGGWAALSDQCRWPPAGGTPVLPRSTEVITHPVVGDLDGDGLPEIAFITFAQARDADFGINGILRIISGADCSDIVSMVDPGCVTCFGEPACRSLDDDAGQGILCSTCGLAIADLDRDGFMEVIGLSEGDGNYPDARRRLVIFDHLGQFKACSLAPPEPMGYFTHPAVADFDGDGAPEIAGHSTVYRPDGSIRFSSPRSAVGLSTIADVDGDGRADLVMGDRVLRDDGSVLWDRPDLFPATPAVADLDGDCLPEIVLVTWHQARVSVVDGATGALRATTQLPGGLSICTLPRPGQGGPPALADVDGDCLPEIGVAGCRDYAVFHFDAGAGSLNLVWQQPTQDISSRTTSSTFFDLDGDGRTEVLYNDERTLWRFDGATGAVLDTLPNTTFTLAEYPAVADVDADGAAEIVVPSNAIVFCCDTGVRVIEDPNVPWVPTRSLQNQHAYHVTNIADDGTIPAVEEPSWSRGNAFRSQVAPTSCEAPCTFVPSCSISVAPAACTGPRTRVPIVGAIQQDAVAGAIRHEWSTDCPGGIFDDASALATELELDGAPPCPRTCRVTLTLTTGWGAVSSCSETVTVFDDVPPQMAPPGDVLIECDQPVPPPPVVQAFDDCDPSPGITFAERRTDAGCPQRYFLTRTWVATDACGNSVTREQVVTVRDTIAPTLTGVPADVTVECPGVPPVPTVTASDACDPDPAVAFSERRIDGRCAGEYQLVRTWTATDACGNSVSRRQVVSVVDTGAPVITPSTRPVGCLWPPNHWYVCLDRSVLSPEIRDACGGDVTWSLAGCASDQPDDANGVGDGHTVNDCVILEDGSGLCARSERDGIIPEGRHYGIAIVAVDGCGNTSAPVVVATLYVPHDQDPHERGCLNPTKVGCRPNQDIPCD